jgi:hypothetical protein
MTDIHFLGHEAGGGCGGCSARVEGGPMAGEKTREQKKKMGIKRAAPDTVC